MRVLVTGSSGFVGKHVVATLRAANHEVFKPTSIELNLLHSMQDMVSQDIESFIYNYKIDAVVHLAGSVGGIGFNKGNQGRLGFENLQMGLNVLEACRLANIKKLIMIGTTCSYPHTPKTIPFIENELFSGMPEPTNSGYGVAKRTLVKMGIEYHNQYGMSIVNLIPTNMVGEFDHFEDDRSHVIPALIKKFEAEEKYLNKIVNGEISIENSMNDPQIPTVVLWGDGSASRDFLYAGDCARAIAICLEKDVDPEPINLGLGKEITIKQLAELIKRIGNYNADIVWDNSKPNGQPRRCLNTSRAKELLGWEATTSLEEALKRTIEWYRVNHE